MDFLFFYMFRLDYEYFFYPEQINSFLNADFFIWDFFKP